MPNENKQSLEGTTESADDSHEETTQDNTEETASEDTSNEDNDEGEGTAEKSDMSSLVKNLRHENGKKRIENKKLRSRVENYESMMGTFNRRLIRSELKSEALKAGLVDTDALKMFDTSDVSITDDGDVEGVSNLVSAMKEAKPYLFEVKSKDTSVKTGSPAATTAKIKYVATLSKDEYEIQKAKDLNAARKGY